MGHANGRYFPGLLIFNGNRRSRSLRLVANRPKNNSGLLRERCQLIKLVSMIVARMPNPLPTTASTLQHQSTNVSAHRSQLQEHAVWHLHSKYLRIIYLHGGVSACFFVS
jgi:hypothetical protein